MLNKSPMFEFSKAYKPFIYPWAVEMAQNHERIHWIEQEVTLEEDINDWKRNKLSEYEKEFITQILRLFTQSDVAVGRNYYDLFLPVFRNNELRNMLGSFAAREAIHQRAYALLNDSLGLPEGDYAAFLEYADMKAKMEHMSSFHDNIGHVLAKAIFNEGVSLFASFAMLLNFQRRGLMRGMGKVVEWSVRDESCFTGDTEVLTEAGWRRFDTLDKTLKVAQYQSDYGTVSFAPPLRHIEKPFEGSLYNFKYDKLGIDITCTEDHDLLVKDDKLRYGMAVKEQARLFEPSFHKKFICAGELANTDTEMTWEELFRVAYSSNTTFDLSLDLEGFPEHKSVKFFIQGNKQIENFKLILENVGYYHTIDHKKKAPIANFHVQVPKHIKKDLNWINLGTLSATWCEAFVSELYLWYNGGIKNDLEKCDYSSKSMQDIDAVQSICAISGYKAVFHPKKWNKNTYILTMRRECDTPTGNVETTIIPYAGNVYCVTMPQGNIIVRQNNRVIVIGNCHVEGITALFKAFTQEQKQIVNNDFKKAIYEMAKTTVGHEDNFIDSAFKTGTMEGLTADDTKTYIRYLTDRRLIQMGLKGIFKVKNNPLLWLESILNAPSHDNFFEGRVASYEVAGLKGEWGY